MSTAQIIPVFDPQGVLRDIPEDQLAAAVKAGGMPAVKFEAPDKSIRFVPANKVPDASKAGGKMLPFEQQDVKHPGFWSTLIDDAKGLLHPSGLSPYPGMDQEAKSDAAAQAGQQDQARKAGGYSLPYRAAVPVAQSVGLNVPGMEQSASEGDTAGVLGHAAAPVAAIATGKAIAEGARSHFAQTLADRVSAPIETLRDMTPKQAAQAVGGVTGAGLGHGTLSIPGAYYGAKGAGSMVESILGKARANAPIVTKPTFPGAPLPEDPGVFPGAPNPKTPVPELLQANALLRGPQPAVDPAAGLGQIKVSSQAMQQAVQELGPKTSVPDIRTRAMAIQQQLNDALGGRALQPNVPLRMQTPEGAIPKEASAVPEGHTAVESSAVKSFKYDAGSNELHVKPIDGRTTYVYGDVSPEQAQAFAAADSKGTAWLDLRKSSSVPVAKIIDGKRIALRPVVKASDDLTGVLEEALKQALAQK